jgi:hypothetical protein
VIRILSLFKFGFKFVEPLELKFDSTLHDAAGSQILPLHYAVGSQILPLHNAVRSQILPPHDAAGSQFGRGVKSYGCIMQRGVNLAAGNQV